MAKKKTTKKTTRRKSSGRSTGIMAGVTQAAMLAAGVVAGNMIAGKLPIADPKVRSGAMLLGGVMLGRYLGPQFAMIGLGVSVGGALNLAATMFPQLTTGAVQGIGALGAGQVRLLEQAVRSRSMNGPNIVGPNIVGDADDIAVMYL